MSLQDKVLIVDDDPGFHRLVESVLVPTGISVQAVRTGEEALKLIQDDRPLAMLIDGLLPGIRGDEVAAKVRAKYPKESLPIFFVSAFFRDLRSRKRLLEEIQVDLVLHKPISVEDLKRAFARYPNVVGVPVDLAPDEELELDISTAVDLLTDFLGVASERIAAMRASMENLHGEGRADAVKALRTEAHKFRGTGTSFGLPEVTRLGAQMEDLIERHKFGALPTEAVSALAGMLDALEVKLARAGASVPSPGTRGSARAMRVVVIDGAGDLATSCGEAANKGLPVRLFADLNTAVSSIADEPADVVFVAGDRPGIDGPEACYELTQLGIGPVVLMASDAGFAARLKAQQRGAKGYVHRLPDAASLLRMAPEFAAPPRGVTVLAVSSDRKLLGSIAETLSGEGLSVTPCSEPRELFELLDDAPPAVIVLSAELPGVNGLSLLKALRADVRHKRLPVLVLAKSDARRDRLDALEAGADDVLPAPLNAQELVARVRVQLRHRARELLLNAPGTLPGFPGRELLLEELARAITLARRGRTLALLVMEGEIDSIAKERGRLEADAAIAGLGARVKGVFRVSDVVAHLGNARFGVLLHDISKEDAQRLLAQHVTRFNEEGPFGGGAPIAVRGSWASFPEIREGAEALLKAAIDAIEAPVPEVT